MDDSTGQVAGGLGAAVAAFALWMGKAGRLGSGCTDQKCRETVQKNSARLDDGDERFNRIEQKLDKIAEDTAFMRGLTEARK